MGSSSDSKDKQFVDDVIAQMQKAITLNAEANNGTWIGNDAEERIYPRVRLTLSEIKERTHREIARKSFIDDLTNTFNKSTGLTAIVIRDEKGNLEGIELEAKPFRTRDTDHLSLRALENDNRRKEQLLKEQAEENSEV